MNRKLSISAVVIVVACVAMIVVRIMHVAVGSPESSMECKEDRKFLNALRLPASYRPWNRSPLSASGLVVDEEGNPISGATIVYSSTTVGRDRSSSLSTISEPDGRFHVSGLHGMELGLSADHPAFRRIPASSVRVFPRNSPLIALSGEDTYRFSDEELKLVLRRRQSNDSLEHREWYEVPMDTGGRFVIDLSQGEAASHEVVIVLKKQTAGSDTGRFGWSLEIGASAGKVLKREDELQFEAPENGYENVYQIAVSPHQKPWNRLLIGSFFVCFGDNTFGMFYIDCDAGLERCMFEGWYSPSGSRILEGKGSN